MGDFLKAGVGSFLSGGLEQWVKQRDEARRDQVNRDAVLQRQQFVRDTQRQNREWDEEDQDRADQKANDLIPSALDKHKARTYELDQARALHEIRNPPETPEERYHRRRGEKRETKRLEEAATLKHTRAKEIAGIRGSGPPKLTSLASARVSVDRRFKNASPENRALMVDWMVDQPKGVTPNDAAAAIFPDGVPFQPLSMRQRAEDHRMLTSDANRPLYMDTLEKHPSIVKGSLFDEDAWVSDLINTSDNILRSPGLYEVSDSIDKHALYQIANLHVIAGNYMAMMGSLEKNKVDGSAFNNITMDQKRLINDQLNAQVPVGEDQIPTFTDGDGNIVTHERANIALQFAGINMTVFDDLTKAPLSLDDFIFFMLKNQFNEDMMGAVFLEMWPPAPSGFDRFLRTMQGNAGFGQMAVPPNMGIRPNNPPKSRPDLFRR